MLPLSDEVVHLERGIGGTIFAQLERIETYLWTNTRHGMTQASDSFQRIELHEYPRLVLRELSVNLLAHRDYTNVQSAARVLKFLDRIEWINPGGLLPGITLNDLLIAQAARNPTILTILFEAGLVEAFGQGLDTVVAVLARESLQPPRFDEQAGFFLATVYGRSLDIFGNLDLYARLTHRQQRILTLLQANGSLAPQEFRHLLGEDIAPRSLVRDLNDLKSSKLIEAIGKGRATRYRLREGA